MLINRLSPNLLKAINWKMAQTTKSFFNTDSLMPCKEFEIPVPWGHIAAKAWGDSGGRPVLGLHGYLDNANTFLRLAPYLPSDLYFVSIDWPGHGRSSHRPPGTMYYHADYVMDIKRAVDGLGWDKFSMIGHSLGGGVAFMFASAFPKAVEKLVLIEGLTPIPRLPEQHGERFSKCFHQLVKTESYRKEDEKLYTEEELVQRFKLGHEWCTESSARILMERAVTSVQTDQGTKFSFTRDPRIKIPSPISYTSEGLKSSSSRQRCEILFIGANDGFASEFNSVVQKFFHDHFQSQTDILKEVCKKFEAVYVPGNHHTHLNTPEHAAPSIVDFFKNRDPKL